MALGLLAFLGILVAGRGVARRRRRRLPSRPWSLLVVRILLIIILILIVLLVKLVGIEIGLLAVNRAVEEGDGLGDDLSEGRRVSGGAREEEGEEGKGTYALL